MDYLLFVFLFLMISYGLTLIITQGSIFEGLRNYFNKVSPNFFGILLSCVKCTGFWVGLLLGVFFNPIYPFILAYLPVKIVIGKVFLYIISIVLCGGLSSGFSWLLNSYVEYLNITSELSMLQKKEITYKMLSNLDSDVHTDVSVLKTQIIIDILEELNNEDEPKI